MYYVYYMHSTCATFTMSIVDVVHCMDYLHGLHSRQHDGVCESMGLHGKSVATYHTVQQVPKYCHHVYTKPFHGTQFVLLSFYGA